MLKKGRGYKMERMMILIQGHLLHKLSWFTLASLVVLAALVSEVSSKASTSCQKEYRNLRAPYLFGNIGRGQHSPTQARLNNSASYIATAHIAAIPDLSSPGIQKDQNPISYETVNHMGCDSFGFMGGSTKVSRERVKLINMNTLSNHWSSGGSGCCNTSIPKAKGIKSLVPEVEPNGATPSRSMLIVRRFKVGNISSAAQDAIIRPISTPVTRLRTSALNKLEYDHRFSKPSQVYRKTGRGYPTHQVFPVKLTLGIGFCCSFLLFGITGIYSSVKTHKIVKLKSKFFQKNGGLLLEQHIGVTKIFTAEELKMTTDYYTKSHIFGSGDSGTVYKGSLPDEVAEVGQIERFINDIVTLTKMNHPNVMKLLGCCLETEAPMMVYELAGNGTLFDCIHHTNGRSPLPWHILLKIASESAAALAYMHSAAPELSKPMIIHGNVMSSNILLTDCFMAKVSGLKPSRLVPINESQISTLVHTTLGYLDPEYLRTGLLTDKSDVYSFGVVLLEILTGEIPVSFNRPENQRIITSHFLSCVEQNQNGLFQIVAPQLVNEGNREQLRAVGELAKRCLKLSSAERPTMEYVAGELNSLSNMYPRIQV